MSPIYASTRMTRVEPGQSIEMLVAYSEAACAYGIAGKKCRCLLGEDGQHATVSVDGRPYAGIFTPGELGFLNDDRGFYCYPEGI